jgi:hypothetical protein
MGLRVTRKQEGIHKDVNEHQTAAPVSLKMINKNTPKKSVTFKVQDKSIKKSSRKGMQLGKQLGSYFKSLRGTFSKKHGGGDKSNEFWNFDVPMSDYSNDSTNLSEIHQKYQRPGSAIATLGFYSPSATPSEDSLQGIKSTKSQTVLKSKFFRFNLIGIRALRRP